MWPTPQDYNEAIQQPGACFAEACLKAARVELNHLGLPRPMTGAFASVYRLSSNKGSWAVRCFLEERDDMKERYEAIARAISRSNLPFFADFDFIERGIKVKSDWYPILKMEWIEGESIEQYLNANLKATHKIAQVHKQFRTIVKILQDSGIAHGDLQHGNILVGPSGLKLIDYDGMYVPELSGRESHELGHRNFQHPDRSHGHFSAALDNFSIWVIDLALRALIVDPDLWVSFNGGDDCLLLRHGDLKSPEESVLLNLLLRHQSKDLAETAMRFREVLELRPDLIPDYRAEERTIRELRRQQDSEIIDQSLTPSSLIKSDPSCEPSSNLGSCAGTSFSDYDAWFASQVKQRGTIRKSREDVIAKIKQPLQSILARVAPVRESRKLIDEGRLCFDCGDYAEAIRHYTKAAELLKPIAGEPAGSASARLLKGLYADNEDDLLWILCEVLIHLGYCHVERDQLGIAAHYFRESQHFAEMGTNSILAEQALQSRVLLAATYFEQSRLELALNELMRKSDELSMPPSDKSDLLAAAIRREKYGPFARRLTLSMLMTELGHGYLVKNELSSALSSYQSAMECCCWIDDEDKSESVSRVILRANAGVCATKIAGNDKEDAAQLFFNNSGINLERLRDLIRLEMQGSLKADWRLGELMRLSAHQFQSRKQHEEARLAFTAALMIFRSYDDDPMQQLRVADCLLGLGKSLEAVALLLENLNWQSGFSRELTEHLVNGKVVEYSHALVVSAVIFHDITQRYRINCLDALVRYCPDCDALARIFSSFEGSDLEKGNCYFELLLDLSRELNKSGKEEAAKLAYAATFKAYKRTDNEKPGGSELLECLLAMGDLNVAAELIIEAGNMQRMVGTMLSIMVGQKTYHRDVMIDLILRVLDTLLSRPAAAVSEDEVNKAMELLAWCAEERPEIIAEARARVSDWLKDRELKQAHNLIEQGNFTSAIAIFEKYQGADGPDVISIKELWVMRYLSASLIDRDRGYITSADGYAFACATALLNSLREQNCLSPEFALQVAKLVRTSRSIGAERYIDDLRRLFIQSGPGLEEAVQTLTRLPGPPSDASKVFAETTVLKNVEESIGRPTLPGDRRTKAISHDEDLESSGRLSRVFFLLEQENYSEAMAQLDAITSARSNNHSGFDLLILRGYCQFFSGDDSEAVRSWRLALILMQARMSYESRILFAEGGKSAAEDSSRQFCQAALCLSLKHQRLHGDRLRLMKRLANPSISKRDLFKLAAQVVGRPLSESDNLADILARALLERANRDDAAGFKPSAQQIYRTALLIFGVRNRRCRLEVIECLDAVGKQGGAALLIGDYVGTYGFDEALKQRMKKIARRYIRVKNIARVRSLYEQSGAPFQKLLDECAAEYIMTSISKTLSGQAPIKMLSDIYHDMLSLFNQKRLTEDLCINVTGSIESAIRDNMKHMQAHERIERCREGLASIAAVIGKVDGRSARAINDQLDALTSSSQIQEEISFDVDLFQTS